MKASELNKDPKVNMTDIYKHIKFVNKVKKSTSISTEQYTKDQVDYILEELIANEYKAEFVPDWRDGDYISIDWSLQ